MRLPHIPLAIATALLVAAPAIASPMSTAPASVVVAMAGPLNTLIDWAPVAGADSYRVYGVDGSTTVLLTETADVYALVETGFNTYAVSAMVGGSESRPTSSSTSAARPRASA
jgi:hypothetical protein